MNISSIVVRTNSKDTKELVSFFEDCDFCDYHFCDEKLGKIVLTIEGKGVDEEIKKLKLIQQIPKVISADMMMSYSEDELENERENIELNPTVPEVLNDNDIDARDIVYAGDLKKKNI